MRILNVALSAVAVAGCTIAESRPVEAFPPGTCRNEPLDQFVGQSASQKLGDRMLAASGARTLRWVPKDGVVTMDFSPSRLTVQLDANNRIQTARCG